MTYFLPPGGTSPWLGITLTDHSTPLLATVAWLGQPLGRRAATPRPWPYNRRARSLPPGLTTSASPATVTSDWCAIIPMEHSIPPLVLVAWSALSLMDCSALVQRS